MTDIVMENTILIICTVATYIAIHECICKCVSVCVCFTVSYTISMSMDNSLFLVCLLCTDVKTIHKCRNRSGRSSFATPLFLKVKQNSMHSCKASNTSVIISPYSGCKRQMGMCKLLAAHALD